MHASSMENMQRCYDTYIDESFLIERGRTKVLDLGGADVNGSYAEIFCGSDIEYIGADMEPREGVSLVLHDPYQIPIADGSVDVVISGQMLEHCEYFWRMFKEMARVLKGDGYIFLISPSSGPIHRYPVDCYRLYPDAYMALANSANISLLDCWKG